MLTLADNLKLPVDAATQTFAFIGRKGSGKTYGAGKLTELLIGAGVQTIVLDLVGKWWGLRLSADGKEPGIDIAMFGGLRGDMPLESAGGAIIADALLESGRSAILDLSQFSKGGRQEFAFKFGQRLWQQQKAQLNPVPVHVVIEESQLIVPENIPAGGKEFLAQMYGIFEEIIRLGRNYGIGVTLITQRPQSVAKEVLNQAEPLLVFQVIGAHERKAIRDWIRHQGMDEGLTDSLPGLKKGECWFWSPEWLNKLERVQIAAKTTFDSTATPKVGAKQPKARAIKPLDLSDLQEKMKATIERAKADNPKALRARIADLERIVAKPAQTLPKVDPAAIERAYEKGLAAGKKLSAESLFWANRSLLKVKGEFDKFQEEFGRRYDAAHRQSPAASTDSSSLSHANREEEPVPVRRKSFTKQVIENPRPTPRKDYQTGKPKADCEQLSKAERAILTAFYWLADEEATPAKVAFYSNYSAGTSTMNNALGRLRHGLISGWRIEPAGIALADSWGVRPKPSGDELIAWIKGKLSRAEVAFLEALIAWYPRRMTNEELAEASCYSPGTSTFNNAIGRLRTLEVAEGYAKDGGVKASDVFFE